MPSWGEGQGSRATGSCVPADERPRRLPPVEGAGTGAQGGSVRKGCVPAPRQA